VVSVYREDGTLAALYSDDGVTAQANPMRTDANGEFAFYAADGVYSITLAKNGHASRTISGVRIFDGATVSNTALMAWALSQSFRVVSATRDANEAITSASIVWPDGVLGTFTADVLSAEFPGAIDAWHATYNGSTAKTVTQPAVTRNSSGAVTAQPPITIT
jgi:hypothetical protein